MNTKLIRECIERYYHTQSWIPEDVCMSDLVTSTLLILTGSNRVEMKYINTRKDLPKIRQTLNNLDLEECLNIGLFRTGNKNDKAQPKKNK